MATQLGPLKIGGDKPWKIYTGIGLFSVAVLYCGYTLVTAFGGSSTPPPPAPPTATKAAPVFGSAVKKAATEKAATEGSRSLDPTLHFDLLALSEKVEYSGNGRNVFSLAAPPPPIPKVLAPIRPTGPVQPPGPPPPPPKPKIMLTFYGYESSRTSGKRVFLINQTQDVFIAGEGDIIDRRYKIVKISNNSVDVMDILNDDTQTLHLTTQTS